MEVVSWGTVRKVQSHLFLGHLVRCCPMWFWGGTWKGAPLLEKHRITIKPIGTRCQNLGKGEKVCRGRASVHALWLQGKVAS